MNLLVMSLVSAAALSFSSCSSNDDLTGGGSGNQSKVEGFYMTLAVQTPTSNGTRTQQQEKKVDATEAESKVTSGTFYLVNAKGEIVFTKNITETEWEKAAPVLTTPGKTQIQVPVQNVTEGETYNVYFLANTTDAKPWESIFAPAAEKFTTTNMFDAGYATANKFAMFNQNDNKSRADQYTVTFTTANKDIKTPAHVTNTIKLDRVTARIDKPTSETTTINGVLAAGASALQQKAVEDAKAKVKSITLTNYAITNLSNKTNIMPESTEYDDKRIVITDKRTGKVIFNHSLPWFLALCGERTDKGWEDQEYLDRQDHYTLVFYVPSPGSDYHMDARIKVNGWVLNLQNADLGAK